MPSRYLQSADLRSRRLTRWYFQPQSHGWVVCCQLLGWNMESLDMYITHVLPKTTRLTRHLRSFPVSRCTIKMKFVDSIFFQNRMPTKLQTMPMMCVLVCLDRTVTPSVTDLQQGCWRTWRAIAHWPFLDQLWCHVGCALEVVRFGMFFFFGVCLTGQVVFPARSILFHRTLSVFVMNAASWWYCKWWSAMCNTLN